MVFLRNGSVVQQRSFIEELLNLPFQIYALLRFFMATLFYVSSLAHLTLKSTRRVLPAAGSDALQPAHPATGFLSMSKLHRALAPTT